MTDPAIATTLLKSALVPAFKSADQWLGKARAEVKNTKKYNVSACVNYLEAARTAIRGLEDELARPDYDRSRTGCPVLLGGGEQGRTCEEDHNISQS